MKTGAKRRHDVQAPEPAKPLVVGIGASAGGLEAFTDLLKELPGDTGIAFALVQHLDPTHVSNLAEILGRATAMPVRQVSDGMPAEPDSVYIIPPDHVMRVRDGCFVLGARGKGRRPVLSVDILLDSLAQEYGDRSIGVVLSGAASDGVKGLGAIGAAGGITIVQDPATAAYSSMPASAIAAGVADYVLPVAEIAAELVRLARHPYLRVAGEESESADPGVQERGLAGILARMHVATGLDLSHYKRATLNRRIKRRMAMRRADDYESYLLVLREDENEVAALFGEVLVRVTSFFRDPEAFQALSDFVRSDIARTAEKDPALRVWVAGCATGQEAYSVAMVLVELLEQAGSARSVQVFASDLREGDLEFARRGRYPLGIESEVSAGRLDRFFTRLEDGYQINKSIRELCVFARHDVTADPPFARVDLVTCRNMLIYMDNSLQRKVLTLFHYALSERGTLFLGASEGVGAAPGLFERTDHKNIFRRSPQPTPAVALGSRAGRGASDDTEVASALVPPTDDEPAAAEALQRLDELLLERYSPAAVMVSADLRVLQLRGEAGAFLRPRPGPASLDLASMASAGFVSAVRKAVEECAKTGASTRRAGLKVRTDTGYRTVELVVFPLARTGAPASYAVLLGEQRVSARPHVPDHPPEAAELEYLRQELGATADKLRFESQRRDTVSEELRAANEEVQSSNEELQSINEQLETAQEELESTNEELATLNDELQARNRDLDVKNEDLNNLLASVCIPIVMLDRDLVIRRYTSQAASLFSLIPADVGRPITDIRSHLNMADFDQIVHGVLDDGVLVDREVSDDSGHWYRISVRPYRTEGGGVEGVVISLLDVDAMRRYQEELATMWRFSQAVNRVTGAFDEERDFDAALRRGVQVASDVLGADVASVWFGSTSGWSLAIRIPESEGQASGREPSRGEAESLDAAMAGGPVVAEAVTAGADGAEGQVGGADGPRSLLTVRVAGPSDRVLAAIRFEFLKARGEFPPMELDFAAKFGIVMALAFERMKRTELALDLADTNMRDLQRTSAALEQASHVKDLFLANMSHELRTPLNSIIGFSSVLLEGLPGELNEEQQRQIAMVLRSGKHLLAIISDILDIEKIQAGAMPVVGAEFAMSELVESVAALMRPLAEAKGLSLEVAESAGATMVTSDELKLRQILLNLVTNAVKYTDTGSIRISVEAKDDDVSLVVTDTGRGLTPTDLKRSFIEFARLGDEGLAVDEGTGLGLSIARRLCKLLGGDLTAISTPGVGSTFRATVRRTLEV